MQGACFIFYIHRCRIPFQVQKMNSRIVVLLALFALVPFVLGRNLGFWRLFDEPGKWNAKNDHM